MAGSSKQGKAFRASVGWNCVEAIHLISKPKTYTLSESFSINDSFHNTFCATISSHFLCPIVLDTGLEYLKKKITSLNEK